MKRFTALLLALLLLSVSMPAMADSLDLSVFRDNSNIYTIDVNTDSDVAFIEAKMTTKERSFTHKHESSSRYSSTQFDILIVNYLKTSAYPVMRLWITYCSDDDYLNITSATFIINGKEYTFSGIGNKDWYVHDENGYLEQVLIKFGMDNLEFLADLESLFNDTTNFTEKAEATTGKLILHGRENIEVDIGYGFFMDYLLIKTGFIQCNGLDYLDKAAATTMKVTEAK